MPVRRAGLIGLALVFLLSSPAVSQSPEWFGTWRLNLQQSTYSPGPPPHVRATRRVEAFDDGIRIVENLVRTRGGVTHLEWTGRLDGRDYRVHGVDLFVTYAYREVDAHTLEGIIKVDGAVTSTSRETLSPDGTTLTIVTIGQNSQENLKTTTVYQRIGDL